MVSANPECACIARPAAFDGKPRPGSPGKSTLPSSILSQV
jgi:hypothetical protein